MPVIFDASAAQTGNRVTGASTVSWSHTRGNVGANHWLIVIVTVSVASAVAYNSATVTKSATYGSQSMTFLGGATVNTNNGWIFVFGLQDPDPGTNTVTFNVSSSYAHHHIMGNSVGYFNVSSIGSVLTSTGSGFSSYDVTGAQLPSGSRGVFAIANANTHIFMNGPSSVDNRYGFGASVSGDADYMVIADIIGMGSATSITPCTGNSGQFATVFLALNATTDGYKEDELTIFDTAGSYSYSIPDWCNQLDIVLLGGGEAGTNGTVFGNGSGGLAGAWAGAGILRGTHIPWSTTQLSVTVGAGGVGNGAPGSASTTSATGMTTVSAAGGSGNRGATNPVGQGVDPVTLNGAIFAGGSEMPNLNNSGNVPGGGGAGGGFSSAGGNGAVGRVWIYARKNNDANNFFSMFPQF